MPSSAVDANPFLGLRPFAEGDAAVFFGRERQVQRLIGRLGETRLLAVVGSSGCGKSSLVLAGLVPALRHGSIALAGDRWRIASLRPGAAPTAALAQELAETLPDLERFGRSPSERKAALLHTLERGELGLIDCLYQARLDEHENILLIVDQFEELFNYAYAGIGEHAASADDAAAFVKLLLAAAARTDVPVYVVLTMRSDFIGDCARFRDLPEAVNAGLFLVPRLARDEMRSAIERPVSARGAKMTPKLVTRLLNDIGSDSDALPILQHALMRTWAEWAVHATPEEPIDVPHYTATGEMGGALEKHAETIYRELSPQRQLLAQKLFRCLTTRDSENREKRRPTAFSTASKIVDASRAEMEFLIATYNAPRVSFLRPPGPPPYDHTVLDIAHEALMRLWKRLAQWVDREAEAGKLYARLVDDASIPRAAWIDPDLALAQAWLHDDEAIINPAWAARYDSALAAGDVS